MTGTLERAGRAVEDFLPRAWPILQQTAAAVAAWVLAKYVLGHPEPFFAPMAAVIALNTSLGERGLNAVRLVEGVLVGIAVGELTLLALGGGWGTLALGTFVALAIAQLLGGRRITLAQAGLGAILTITAGQAEAGYERLVDALVGAGVALVFSQLLFSPEPVALVRRASASALAGMADGLGLTAQALERNDDELGEEALTKLRGLRDQLSELSRVRAASSRVVRRSAVWRRRRGPLVRENENAGYLDLLGGTCLILTRTALALPEPDRARLAGTVGELASILKDLSEKPGDQATRQRAADRVIEASRHVFEIDANPGSVLAGAVTTVRMVAVDVMSFAGVDPGQAFDAVQRGVGEFDVPTPPPAARIPFTGR